MMLKLRDFLHLPQLDPLIGELIADPSGVILLAGLDSRPNQGSSGAGSGFLPSGLSAIFNILLQEILQAHPLEHVLVVAGERSLARVPRAFQRRVKFVPVEPGIGYAQQIEAAARQRPGMIVVDSLNAETAAPIFSAAGKGLRVLTQLDTVVRGAAICRHLMDFGLPRSQLAHLHWVLTNQRMSTLCPHCKQAHTLTDHEIDQLCSRYPHLRRTFDQFNASAQDNAKPPPNFYQAVGCEHCRGTGYQGDIAVFDLLRNDPQQPDPMLQPSLLSLEEYALLLAADGVLSTNDLLALENEHLRRTYSLLTSSQQALTSANAALNSKVFELEASNRVLLQRTEALMSLQDLGQALITNTDLSGLAERVCRSASALCGAERVVLYLRRVTPENMETAEILGIRGWDRAALGQNVPPAQVFDNTNEAKPTRFMHTPPGVRPLAGTEKSVLHYGLRVPLIAQSSLVGVMVVQCEQKISFTPGETALLQTFANQAALAIQRAGLVDELRAKIRQLEEAQAELVQKERIEHELELARQVQQQMLPHHFPSIHGFSLAAHNEPARQVGGDFYDVFVLDDNHFGVVVADVADKGMPAALYMALTRSLLLAEARRASSPAEALRNVNRLLLELGELNGFVSVFYGMIERSTRQMTYARAGHERPLLLRAGKITHLAGSGLVLGIVPSEELNLSEEVIDLQGGDRLILYSDGLTDVTDRLEHFLGLAAFEQIVQANLHLPAQQLCSTLFDRLNDYRGDTVQFDDMTLLVVEVDA